MRIIAGKYRHRNLVSLPGLTTRPSGDAIKESVFNSIGPYFDGGTMLDCCSGSGAIGLECISRGFDHAILVENDRQAAKVIQTNIDTLKANAQTTLFTGDIQTYLSTCQDHFDLIYIDPPYNDHALYESIITRIHDRRLLNDDGLMIIETDIAYRPLVESTQLKMIKEKHYRRSSIYIYQAERKSLV